LNAHNGSCSTAVDRIHLMLPCQGRPRWLSCGVYIRNPAGRERHSTT